MKTKYGYEVEIEPYSDITIYNESGRVVCAFTKNDIAKIYKSCTINLAKDCAEKNCTSIFCNNNKHLNKK